jgi:hypothetical protein
VPAPDRPTADIERTFRLESGPAVATPARLLGDLGVAEEAVQDAFVIAVQRWPASGVPPNPAAWIITDTFHNLIDCDDLAVGAIVPGRTEMLHLRGRAFVTDDPPLLATMALNERPPHAALVLRVDEAEVADNDGIRTGRIWDASAPVDPASVPDLMALGAEHLARSKVRGARAAATRAVSKGLAAKPQLLRRGVDRGYRKELDEEGF